MKNKNKFKKDYYTSPHELAAFLIAEGYSCLVTDSPFGWAVVCLGRWDDERGEFCVQEYGEIEDLKIKGDFSLAHWGANDKVDYGDDITSGMRFLCDWGTTEYWWVFD